MMRQEFQIHMLNSAGLEKATALGEIFSEALEKIEALVPAGRERAVVIMKRGIACDPANQKTGA